MRFRKGDKIMNAYIEFAHIYDELMEDIDYCSWMEFVKSILAEHDKKPRDVLEMACGTGNFTRLLCKEGYNVTAFDLSEDMLAIAYNKLDSFRSIQLIKQDMMNFTISKEFDMIISVCDSINYITDYSELMKTFDNVYSRLKPEGVFIFDVNSKYKLKNIIGNNTFVVDQEDVFYVWENEYDDAHDTCEFYITFFVKEQDLYKRFEEVHVEKAYTSSDIENALRKSGFSLINVYDGYTRELPREDSERLTFLALK